MLDSLWHSISSTNGTTSTTSSSHKQRGSVRWLWCHTPSLLLGVAVALLLTIPYLNQTQPRIAHAQHLGYPCSGTGGQVGSGGDTLGQNNQQQPQQQLQQQSQYDAAAAAKLVQELAALGNCGKSKQGKRYRSLLCLLVRNDIHIREFVVRYLLLGFCHLVINDNNQVLAGRDYNMTLMLQPFVEQGLVTHIPYEAGGTQGFLDLGVKVGSSSKCMQEYGSQADWALDVDSDEYLFVSKDTGGSSRQGSGMAAVAAAAKPDAGNSNLPAAAAAAPTTTTAMSVSSSQQQTRQQIGVLAGFLDDVEQHMPDACGLELPWRMMYGEHRVLNTPGQLLMDTFPRMCTSASQKVMLRPDRATYQPPHWVHCINKTAHKAYQVDSEERKKALPQYQLHHIHYYAKTVEEYIAKSEQSQPPYFRKMVDMYDTSGGTTCTNEPVAYTPEYREAVHRFVAGLRTAQGGLPDGGQMLGPLPEYKPHSRDDYTLYLFLKLRVDRRSEWDEAAYLSRNSTVSTAIQEHKFFDGLHHFISEGFNHGLVSCWNDTRVLPAGRNFCIP